MIETVTDRALCVCVMDCIFLELNRAVASLSPVCADLTKVCFTNCFFFLFYELHCEGVLAVIGPFFP